MVILAATTVTWFSVRLLEDVAMSWWGRGERLLDFFRCSKFANLHHARRQEGHTHIKEHMIKYVH
jgi:hypothetical protein